MNRYLGVKLISAEQMNLGDYNKMRGWKIPADENPEKKGYKILYPDGYVSWSPKEVFEKFYMQISDNNTIPQELVNSFIRSVEISTHTSKHGKQITIVNATLVNGFTMVESSSCVEIENYNERIGKEICLERIKHKIWEHIGFILQTGLHGLDL